MDENAAAGSAVGSPVAAIDAGDIDAGDIDAGDTVAYRLSGAGAALFDIDGDGQVTVRSSGSLDYETTPSFTLTVTATDTLGAFGTATVIINVANIDEAGKVTLLSPQPRIGTGLDATLSDPDGATGSVSWRWARSSENGASWTDIAGARSDSYTPVIADVGALLRATASYTDPQGSNKTAGAVSAAAVSNAPPVFVSNSWVLTVAENAAASAVVGSPVGAIDVGDDRVAYSLGGAGAALFDIDGDGQVTVRNSGSLDYETTPSFTLTVTATDTLGATGTATVTINVVNVDEAGTVTFSSAQPQVGAGLIAALLDPDGPARSLGWVWAKSSNNGRTWTGIPGATSDTYTPVTADVGAVLRATGSYTDPQGSNKSAIGLQSEPVSNPAPAFTPGQLTFTVNENEAPGAAVGTALTAADTGDDTVTYSLDGPGAALFAVGDDGQITVASGATLDYETTGSYRLTVTATDTSNASSTTTVNIDVTNVDEAGTVTLSSSRPAVGVESTATVSDPDGPTSSVSWRWAKSSNNGNTWTDITGATSASYTPVTADVGALLRATVSYTDPENSGKSAGVVSAAPVSNAPPMFASDSFALSVAENAAGGARVGSPLGAIDAGDDTVAYRLSGAGAALFAVGDDGQITVVSGATLDYETTRSYTLTLAATDTSAATGTATVNIDVTNIDEAGTVTFSSFQPVVGVAFVASLTDLDGPTSSVRWVWAKSSDSGLTWTEIRDATSAVYSPTAADVGALLRATVSYTDPQGSGKSAEAVSAAPASNSAPVFALESLIFIVAENAAAGTRVGSPVTATDAGDTLEYSLGGAGAELFSIDSNGQITVAAGASLDYETTASYRLTLTATDTSNEPTTVTVTINVVNIDEPGTVDLDLSKSAVGRSPDTPALEPENSSTKAASVPERETAETMVASLFDPDAVTPENPSGVLSTGVIWVWARSSNNGATWTDIPGATAAGYTPAADDTDTPLRVTALYTDPQGAAKSASAYHNIVPTRPRRPGPTRTSGPGGPRR